jgi:hypothetical protein
MIFELSSGEKNSVANWPKVRPHSSEMGRVKEYAGRQIRGRICAGFFQEGPKRGRISEQFQWLYFSQTKAKNWNLGTLALRLL